MAAPAIFAADMKNITIDPDIQTGDTYQKFLVIAKRNYEERIDKFIEQFPSMVNGLRFKKTLVLVIVTDDNGNCIIKGAVDGKNKGFWQKVYDIVETRDLIFENVKLINIGVKEKSIFVIKHDADGKTHYLVSTTNKKEYPDLKNVDIVEYKLDPEPDPNAS
jgi:hypothetical protein